MFLTAAYINLFSGLVLDRSVITNGPSSGVHKIPQLHEEITYFSRLEIQMMTYPLHSHRLEASKNRKVV
jgi:hypothetical protein